MKPNRPVAVTVIVVLHFIVAAWGLCGGVLQLSGLANKMGNLGNDPQQERIQRAMEQGIEKNFPAYKTYEKAEGGVALLMAALLIVAAIGLIQMKTWGRMLSYLYAVLAIVHVIVNGIIAFLFVLPGTRDAFAQIPDMPKEAAKVAEVTMIGAFGVASCFGLLYPIVVLIVMSLSSVRRAFAAPGGFARPRDEEVEFDPRDRDRWRESDDEPKDRGWRDE
jgi:hypothetical protein